MTKLAWRQMRLAVAATVLLLAVLVVLLAVSRGELESALRDSGLPDCLSRGGDCSGPLDAFAWHYGKALSGVSLLAFTPLLVGVFWGAPLVAREVELGTQRLVWTQSIDPRRWFAVKAGMFVLVAVLLAGAVTAAVAWWNRPFTGLGLDEYSRMNPTLFNLQGVDLAAFMLFAFGVAVAVGALIPRTVAAMAVAVPTCLLPAELVRSARSHLLPTQSIVFPFGEDYPRAGLGDWIRDTRFLDRAGNEVAYQTATAGCPTDKLSAGKGAIVQCIAEHGFRAKFIFHPMSQFWPLQGIEAGILVTVAALLLVAAAWWTTRRLA